MNLGFVDTAVREIVPASSSDAVQAVSGHRTAQAQRAIPPTKKLPLVPEDRQRDKSDRNNPKNDVFAAAFFLGHRMAVHHI